MELQKFGANNPVENAEARKVLTECELEVAYWLAWGFSKKEIADKTCRAVRTVENHARSIYDKIKIGKAGELAAWWFCTKYGISASDNPMINLAKVKVKILAVLLLTIIVPHEVITQMEAVRNGNKCRISCSARRGRRNNNFEYELS